MSAIAGIYHFDGQSAESSRVDRMLSTMRHRGPDACDIWHADSIALGARLLWTTPESCVERIPLVDRQANLVLTADARIDNRDELRGALGESCPAGQATDSEFILAAYRCWGEQCAERLVGDFAFAIWDARNHRLFCARDAMGLKPFYYYRSTAGFFFASEIKALLALPEIPKKVNPLRIADHVALEYEDREITFYENIFQLPAAHCMTVTPERVQKSRYWTLDPERELALSSEEEYAEALRYVFTEAVRCRMRSSFPLGSMLSGGIDSSSIVCVAKELLPADKSRQLHTFSAIFPTLIDEYPSINERSWMDAVLAKGGVEPHYIHADKLNPLDPILFNADEPRVVPNMYLDWGGFKEAHGHGVRAVFSGVDGDSTVSYGHGYFAELARGFKWMTLYSEAAAFSRRMGWSLRFTLWHFGMRSLVPPTARRSWRKIRGKSPSLLPFEVPINPDFANRTGLVDRIRMLDGDDAVLPQTGREAHILALMNGLNLYSPEMLDKVGAGFSLEPRLPFFDRRVIEFCVSLPTHMKLKGGWSRYVMRRAMEGVLPPEVQWRVDKGNLSPNIRQGLWNHSRPDLAQVLVHHPEPLGPYLDVRGVQDAYLRFEQAPMRATDEDIYIILLAFTLGHWLNKTGLN